MGLRTLIAFMLAAVYIHYPSAAQEPSFYGTYISSKGVIRSLDPAGPAPQPTTMVNLLSGFIFDVKTGEEVQPEALQKEEVVDVDSDAAIIFFNNKESYGIAKTAVIYRDPFISKYSVTDHPINAWKDVSTNGDIYSIETSATTYRLKPLNSNETMIELVPSAPLVPGLYVVYVTGGVFHFTVSGAHDGAEKPCYQAIAEPAHVPLYYETFLSPC